MALGAYLGQAVEEMFAKGPFTACKHNALGPVK
jgi:hypothetical protein